MISHIVEMAVSISSTWRQCSSLCILVPRAIKGPCYLHLSFNLLPCGVAISLLSGGGICNVQKCCVLALLGSIYPKGAKTYRLAGRISITKRTLLFSVAFSHYADWPDTNIVPDVYAAIRVLAYLASKAIRVYQVGTLGVIIHVTVSIVKRGTVSDGFVDKITTHLQNELARCPPLRREVIELFYQHYGNGIDETNVGAVFARWIQLIGQKALRLRLTVEQAAGTGLTSYLIIGRAIRQYVNFPWDRIAAMYRTEWENYRAAVGAVGDNPYYGYRRDLGPVKSTKYKSLAYVAKELLVKVGGEGSLTQYRGWVTRVANQATVDAMIAAFEAEAGQELPGAAALEQIGGEVADLREVLRGHNRVFV